MNENQLMFTHYVRMFIESLKNCLFPFFVWLLTTTEAVILLRTTSGMMYLFCRRRIPLLVISTFSLTRVSLSLSLSLSLTICFSWPFVYVVHRYFHLEDVMLYWRVVFLQEKRAPLHHRCCSPRHRPGNQQG